MIDLPGYTILGGPRFLGPNQLLRARRESDRLPVLLKTPQSPSPTPSERERYLREHGILQRLQEVRGVSRVYGCEWPQGRPVLVLEAMEGESLSELATRPIDISRFLDLAIALASTLAEIHRRGIIHKDLQPAHILLTGLDEPRLIDFGTATLQRVEHVDAAPAPLIEGTLAYISPERTGRMNRVVDYRTDLYSLGVTFYELLTGSLPFHGRDALEWVHAHMAVTPPPPHERVLDVPPLLSAIVMKLLAKVAEERYQGADGLRADLERCREALRRGQPMDFPLGDKDVPIGFQLPQRLYGRGTHVAALLQAFERVAEEGRPELVLVHGYAGIGKSAVVHELHKPVVQRRGFFLSGKFEQFRQDLPYVTLTHAIRGLKQQLLAGSDEELARWRERLNAAWEGQGRVLLDVVPQLELVAGPQPPVPELPPAEAQHRFNRVFRQFLGVFSTAERPLVVFLDDLQWADLATLKLLQHLLTHPEAPPVLLIGAYRDNEVSPSHSLALLRDELREARARMRELRLEPLSQEHIQQLVADALPGAGEAVVVPLSALVREKTGGNPFFLIQFMLTLSQDGLLVRTPEGTWRWDAEGVQQKGYSANVVDFMVIKLRQLPLGTQRLLQLAACVGNTFPLPMLAALSGRERPGEVEQGLEPALQEGLLVRGRPEQYRFLHDRIQQAAQALLPEEERKATHLRIGRRLLASLTPEEARHRLFEIVNHLNAGAELITEPGERLYLARLNAEAGAKARTSVAHRSAITWLTTAFQLLPGDPWETAPELAFQLRLEQANSEFLSGNLVETRKRVEELLSHARTGADLAVVSCLKSNLLMASSEGQGAVTCLLACLERLGMPMSPHPSWEEVMAANEEVWTLLGDRPIESLVELPLMEDPDRMVLMRVLEALFPPAYVTDNNLLILLMSRMVALSLRHGNSEAAVLGYGWYGVVVGPALQRYGEAYAFGKLACALVERYDFANARGRALYSLEIISYWTRPIAVSQELVREAFEHASRSGDYQVACISCNHIVTNRLELGHGLEEVYQESVARMDFVRKAGYGDVQDIIHHTQRYVQQLRGFSRSFGSLSGEDFDEEAFEAGLTVERMSTMRCWYWLHKAQARFMCGAFLEAREAIGQAEKLLWSSLSHIQLLDFHLYRALILAGCFREAPAEERPRLLEEIGRHRQQLDAWASSCPENFRAPERMVFAELARVSGRWQEAIDAYEEALRLGRAHGFIQHVALASELAANFWRDRQVPTIADAYARGAREAYLRWGALAKVRQLHSQWPHLASAALPSATPAARDTSAVQLDALTVVKAQQAISGEIVLERLANTLLRVAIENAGAQRGALVVPDGDTLSVVALHGPTQEGSALSGKEDLPWTLLAYARRAGEHVLIDDAFLPHPFSFDPYLERSHARSLLCIPLTRKGAFHGALYLENNLVTRAFTPERLSLLEHIASQAAISIENARLYADVQRAEAALRRANDELERRVEERTRELNQAQARLVEGARAAGMAEVATNVLHNVGNVLNSAVINLQVMTQTVTASRVGRVKQLASLVEEHSEDLATFFTRDVRGSRLPSYLSALAEELLREQASLREDMAAMNKHVEHIRAIVHVQQTYASSSLLTEECDLPRLVEDALSIQMPALQRHGITVTRELTTLRPVQLDKHKALQILINLISNAKNAMKDKPEGQRHLHVRLAAEGNTARIQVVDTGAGIAPELRHLLFSQGFTTRKDGHGLGLHSSALAAQKLGGRLLLESEGMGKGATATLELPLG